MKQFSLIPDWIRHYNRADFRFDLVAGLTVGVMLIPQGMAYALIAGLPPIYGLYASTLPAIVYAFFGTSRQLSVGPGALTALLTAAGIGLVANAGSQDYFVMVALLTMTVGLIQFLLGLSRLGFLANFLSNPVMLGFTSAAAILIALSQLKHFFGIQLTGSQHLKDIIPDLITQLPHTHIPTLALASGGFILLLLLQKYLRTIPGALIVVILSILITWLFRLDMEGVKIVGYVPGGLPRPQFTGITISDFITLFPTAVAIALVSFMESTAVAREIQSRHKSYKVIANRELIALGLANMMSAFLKSIPVTGGMSRSIVNDQAGARTSMSSIISSILILFTLVFLTSLFYYLPNAILAAIILMAVSRLVKIKEAIQLWAIDRKDFWMMMVTFLGTLILGVGPGIGIGVLLSLAWIIFEAYYPHHAELGNVSGTHSYRNVRRFKDLVIAPGILIFRFDAPLFFANINRFREVLADHKKNRKDKIHTIIIDMESNNSIDSSALNVFSDILDEMVKEEVQLLLADVKGPVRDKLFKSGFTQKLGEKNVFVTIEDAVHHVSGERTEHHSDIALQTNVYRGKP